MNTTHGDGNQPPSGLRGDPGADRTTSGEARDKASSASSAAPIPSVPDPADRCGVCGGPYRFDTTIPSPLWNRIVRPLAGSEYLCATCILQIFAEHGESFTAELWSNQIEAFNGLPIRVSIGPVKESTGNFNESQPVKDDAADPALRALSAKWRDWVAEERRTREKPTYGSDRWCDGILRCAADLDRVRPGVPGKEDREPHTRMDTKADADR